MNQKPPTPDAPQAPFRSPDASRETIRAHASLYRAETPSLPALVHDSDEAPPADRHESIDGSQFRSGKPPWIVIGAAAAMAGFVALLGATDNLPKTKVIDLQPKIVSAAVAFAPPAETFVTSTSIADVLPSAPAESAKPTPSPSARPKRTGEPGVNARKYDPRFDPAIRYHAPKEYITEE
ncbi:MAG: hypothetical protein U0169_10570 [Polyangiaceae bacterium]